MKIPGTARHAAAEPFHCVLVATALDAAGARAARRAARLPLAPGARVVVLHATRPWSLRSRPGAREEAGRAMDGTLAEVEAAARAVGNADATVVPAVSTGWPVTEIVRAAWQHRSELVVVGAPAVRFDGSARGTVARIVRRADLPVLVARGDAARPYRRVLCAVDRTVTAADTVALGARLADPTTRTLTLFHAYHLAFEGWIGDDAPEVDHLAVREVQALARELSRDLGPARAVVRRGEPTLEILRAAEEARADLVVLGTRGRSALSRALVGSAAEWVIANTRFDVAVARCHRVSLERR